MSKKENNVTQQNNVVNNGDLVGRDKNVHVHGPESGLRRMAKEFRRNLTENVEFKGVIEKLQKYMSKSESEKSVRDLEEKLIAGSREDLIREALESKEQFSKKITKNQFSEQAQEIFAHILVNIIVFFNSKIRPLIIEKKEASVIDSLIYDELVTKIFNDIADCGLGVDMMDIKGMLFYLTGNCHLEWD